MTESDYNIHAVILRQHGREVLKNLRAAENTLLKIANWSNHRIFNIRCLLSGITPSSIKLNSLVRGVKAETILRKAEKRLLDLRVRHCSYTIAKLKDDLLSKEAILYEALSRDTQQAVRQYLERRRNSIFQAVKDKQLDKFAKLVADKHAKTQSQQYENNIDKSRWVINKSNTDLTIDQRTILEKGLNFAVSPRVLPTKEVIVSTEIACKFLPTSKAQSLRGEVVKCLKKSKPPSSNISKGEFVAIQELKGNKDITILPADRGRATVILNTTDYETKMATLLNDPTTYELLAKDPTAPYKRKLINIIKRWQSQDPIPQQLKHRIYPTAEEVPKIYGLPKIHKPDFPLRPIVASRGGITYNAARVLADILSPLVGQSEHHVKNSSAFVDKIQDLEVPPSQKLISYDVTALFTSIPVPDAIEAVQLKLSADDTLSERTSLSIDKILELLKFCLDTTYFVYKNQI